MIGTLQIPEPFTSGDDSSSSLFDRVKVATERVMSGRSGNLGNPSTALLAETHAAYAGLGVLARPALILHVPALVNNPKIASAVVEFVPIDVIDLKAGRRQHDFPVGIQQCAFSIAFISSNRISNNGQTPTSAVYVRIRGIKNRVRNHFGRLVSEGDVDNIAYRARRHVRLQKGGQFRARMTLERRRCPLFMVPTRGENVRASFLFW